MQARDLVFRKSSYSNGSGECVEVAVDTEGARYVRDSKDTAGPLLGFSDSIWGTFMGAMKTGQFGR